MLGPHTYNMASSKDKRRKVKQVKYLSTSKTPGFLSLAGSTLEMFLVAPRRAHESCSPANLDTHRSDSLVGTHQGTVKVEPNQQTKGVRGIWSG